MRGGSCIPGLIRSAPPGLNTTPFAPNQLPSLAAWYLATTGLHTDGAVSFASASSQSLSSNTIPTPTAPLSLTFWINPTDRTSNYTCVNFANIGTDYFTVYIDTSGHIVMTADHFGTTVASTATVATGAWSHVAVTYDGTTGQIVINNGIPKTGALTNNFGSAITLRISIGSSTAALNGQMDALKFFGGKVLSAGEITQDYNSGNGVAAKNNLISGAVSGYDFDGPGANLVKDYIGTNTLTNNNTVTYAAGQVSTTSLADGDAVTTDDSQVGSGNNLTQATAGLRGLDKLAIQNGLNVIRFAAGSSQLMAKAFTLIQPCTVVLIGKSPTAGGTIFDGSAATAKLFQSGTTWQTNAGSTLDSTLASDSSWHMFAAVFNGNSSQLTVDGTAGVVGAAGANNPGGLTLASVLAGGSYDSLDFGEAAVYSRVLSAGEIAQLRTYAQRKWATP